MSPSPFQDIPVDFFCPLTKEIMNHPVMSKQGVRFEKATSVDYLFHHSSCPVSHTPLSLDQLVTDHKLLKRIQAYRPTSTSCCSNGGEPAVATGILDLTQSSSSSSLSIDRSFSHHSFMVHPAATSNAKKMASTPLLSQDADLVLSDWGSPFDFCRIFWRTSFVPSASKHAESR